MDPTVLYINRILKRNDWSFIRLLTLFQMILDTQQFMNAMSDFPVINQIYEDWFGSHKPARSCVEVAALPKQELIEIEAVAVR